MYRWLAAFIAVSFHALYRGCDPLHVPHIPLHALQLLGALTSGGWEGSRGLGAVERFTNCVTGYYLLLLFFMLAKRNFKDKWAQYFLPLSTTRNTAYVCAMGMLIASINQARRREMLPESMDIASRRRLLSTTSVTSNAGIECSHLFVTELACFEVPSFTLSTYSVTITLRK